MSLQGSENLLRRDSQNVLQVTSKYCGVHVSCSLGEFVGKPRSRIAYYDFDLFDDFGHEFGIANSHTIVYMRQDEYLFRRVSVETSIDLAGFEMLRSKEPIERFPPCTTATLKSVEI